ncbi:hypothetical protein [Carboxylicivirga sp. M1479]|uniref:hypothetical protein n=1 Tax=Carboxylicivirga sp. M1479 TaxID=2594476 RepID=UPI00117756EE|nr:hypothetical protein [Carboxylicivirga sp. M1479]TRX72104.1 hypothetical protein FNN09_03630 [Carboxylicivirga sp. M1479]
MTLNKLLGIIVLLIFPSLTAISQGDTSPKLKLGGAIRFNYNLSDWKDEQVTRGGDFGYDVFRLNASGSYQKLGFNAEYRFYSPSFGGHMLKQGWIEYIHNQQSSIQLGLQQVPFGLQPYNSNNWFFSIAYYVGLEDDHDMGIKWIKSFDQLQLHAAFYKNAEELNFDNASAISPNRYSYDVAGRNKEVNQGNIKLSYNIGEQKYSSIEISAMYGGLYNIITSEMGSHSASALGYRYNGKRWGLKLQAITFNKNPNDSAQYKDIIEMAAYGSSYKVAAKGQVLSSSVSYQLPIKSSLIDQILLYNDFSWFRKTKNGFNDSYMNVLGCMIATGPIYTYIDSAWGKNHSWLGPEWSNAFAEGTDNAQWHMRFNINIGYYF